jgi:putative toxin-antitoxin system antitoxin component (TIGR02293 family)
MENQKLTKNKTYQAQDTTSLAAEEAIVQYQVAYANPVALLASSKKGLAARAALDFLSISGFTYDEFQLVFKTTVKTIQNYVSQGARLDASLSEKFLKLFSLYKSGIEVFGSIKSFRQWMYVPAYGLGNQTPFSLLDTFTGISLIEDEISRIAFGDLA